MNSRFTSMILTALATLVLLSGCGGTLVIGGKPTYAQNKTPALCSWNQSDSRYGGTKQQSFSQTCTETYELGDMLCTRTWTEAQASQNAPGSWNDGRSKSYSSSQPYCVLKPVPPPAPKPPSLTPVAGASCEWEKEKVTQELFARTCSLASEASGTMSCVKTWKEVWTATGELLRSDYATTKPKCAPKEAVPAPAPKATPAPTTKEAPAVPPQQPRPNFGRKVPT